MKKSLVALAALAVVGAASAQSTVTLFGVVDANVGFYNTQSVGSATKMNTSGLSSSRLGFRGVEDLGGGMTAGFWLEAGLNPDSGTGQGTSLNNQTAVPGNGGLVFNRRSTVSLMGNFGEVRLGRDYTPVFWNTTIFEPFGTLGAAQATNLTLAGTAATTGVRASNSIGYLYNSPGPVGNTGFYGQAQYHMGENTSNVVAPLDKKDGNGLGARVGYAQGPLNVAVATSKIKNLAVGDYTATNIGVSYDIGVAQLMADYNRNNSGTAGTRYQTVLIGATIPMGQGYIPVSLNFNSQNNAGNSKATQFGIGYVYNLSKRTALYTTYAQISNRNGAAFGIGGGVTGAVNQRSSGAEFGLKHSF